VFHYANAIAESPGRNFAQQVLPNLDARLPVSLALTGHAVVCDGYGYSQGSLYYHLVLGWEGNEDAWYNLENIEAGGHHLSPVVGFTYNIFPEETGEIISGRITGTNGLPIAGVRVTAECSGGSSYSGTSDSHGIYAFAAVPPSSSFLITAEKEGYVRVALSQTTGKSVDGGYTTGNIWGSDFTLVFPNSPPWVICGPTNQLIGLDQPVSISVRGTGDPMPGCQWERQAPGSTSWLRLADDATYSGTQTTNLGIAVVLGETDGSLFRCVLTNAMGTATSSPARLTVIQTKPSIVTQPVTQTALPGNAATFQLLSRVSRITLSMGVSGQWTNQLD
jgi:hypothetical protein